MLRFCCTHLLVSDPPANIISLNPQKERSQLVLNVVSARSKTFITDIAKCYPQDDANLLARIRVETMMEVAQYCSPKTTLLVSKVNRYFHRLARTSLTAVTVNCQRDWVASINKSPFIRSVNLVYESKDSEMERFCHIIHNDGFTRLRDFSLDLPSDSNVMALLHAMNDKAKSSIRLGLTDPNDTFSLSLNCFSLSPRVCYAFEGVGEDCLRHVLGSLTLCTSDVEGLQFFFRTVDFHVFSSLQCLVLSNCPLQSKGFDYLVHSLWPMDQSCVNPLPIRQLSLDNTQITDEGLQSLCCVMKRGLLVDLELLNLSANTLTDTGVRFLADAFQQFVCPNLQQLLLSDNKHCGSAANYLFHVLANGVCPLMTRIEMANTAMDVHALRSFATYLRSQFSENLERINISGNPQVAEMLPVFFDGLLHSPCDRLRTLFLENLDLSRTHIGCFLQWLHSGKALTLEHLMLHGNLLDGEAFFQVCQAVTDQYCPSIRVLDFSANAIGDLDPVKWRKLCEETGSETEFEQISFAFNPLSDADMEILVAFMKRFSHFEKTQRITFSNNPISAMAIERYLEAFPSNPCALRFLSISSCCITGSGPIFAKFLESEAARNLDTLQLLDCSFSKEDVAALLRAFSHGSCKSLRKIELNGNEHVDDSFARVFVQILVLNMMPNLLSFSFAFTKLSARGVGFILDYVESNRFTHVQEIDVSGLCLGKMTRTAMKARATSAFSGIISL